MYFENRFFWQIESSMTERRASGMTPRILALATRRSKLIEAETGKTVNEANFRGKTEFDF